MCAYVCVIVCHVCVICVSCVCHLCVICVSSVSFVCHVCVQAWDIERYCLEVHPEVCRDAPPLLLSFRAHLKNIVSLCVAEGRGLLVSASTDCCVRLWTMQGRFIGEWEGQGYSDNLAQYHV